MTGHHGFFYHFLDMKTGHRAGDSELSTVDTALFLAGALFCQSYFDDAADDDEAQIRELAEKIYARVDWRWAQVRPPAISHGWSPECGFLEYDWRGYNEAMIVYLLALGSPTYPVEDAAWAEWTSTYDNSWRTDFGEPHLAFAPLFGHQYCQTWIDFRGLQDTYMSSRGIDYFENNRRADLCSARLCDRQSAWLEGLRQRRLGSYRFRWPGRCRARVCRQAADVSQLCRRAAP